MTFSLYNPNMNKLTFPKGVFPLDFIYSSVSKERYSSHREGKPGNVNNGFDYREREISLKFYIQHFHGEFDERLLRDEINGFLDQYEFFYLMDDNLPTRMIKVVFDESFTIERYGYWYGKMEIKPTVIGHPFFMTTYTTQQIDTLGFDAIQNKFGMADGIHIDYPNYTFSTDTFSVWNGGNVWIDYRNMDLVITVEGLTTAGNFQIQNLTTQETFIYKEAVTNQTLTLDGPIILVGPNNRLRDTNRQFIKIGPGKNDFKITGGTFSKIKFDFRFHNK